LHLEDALPTSPDSDASAAPPAPGTSPLPPTQGSSGFVRQVNWSKLGWELLITFVGVLLALAANAAWVGRQETRREAAALDALQEDLAPYRSVIAWSVAREDSALHSDTIVLAMLRGGRPMAPDSLRRWAHPLLWSSVPPAPGIGIGLTQSGDATMLRDVLLRAHIARFVARSQFASEGIVNLNTMHVEQMEQLIVMLEPFATATGPNSSLDRIIRALPSMRSSMQFRASLATVAVLRENRVRQLKQLAAAADSLAAALPTRRK
jgi:hypothetical protein